MSFRRESLALHSRLCDELLPGGLGVNLGWVGVFVVGEGTLGKSYTVF